MKSFRYVLVALLFLLTLPARAESDRSIRITVDGLVCAFCAQGIDKSLRKLDATEDVYVSLERRLVAVATRDGTDIEDAVITDTLKDAGYTVRAIERVEQSIAAIREEGS